jgi:hypothetical protein
VIGVKTEVQLAVVALSACVATWAFTVSDVDWLRLLLVYPISPGAIAGLLLSGHGGNQAVELITALVTNSVVWCSVWLGLRAFFRTPRR